MTPLSTLVPEVFINVPAELPILNHYILRGAIDFFKRSEAWQITDEITISAGDEFFDIPATAGREFVKLVSLEISDRVLTGDDLRKFCASGESGTVWLAKQADGDITIKATSVFSPSDDATQIDTTIGRQYRDGIIWAALAKLFILPKKPWTDAAMSEFYRGKWENTADQARRSAYEGKQRTARRTRCHLIGGI